MPAWSASVEDSPPGSQAAPSGCVHTQQRASKAGLSGVSDPISRVPLSWPHLNLITSQRVGRGGAAQRTAALSVTGWRGSSRADRWGRVFPAGKGIPARKSQCFWKPRYDSVRQAHCGPPGGCRTHKHWL